MEQRLGPVGSPACRWQQDPHSGGGENKEVLMEQPGDGLQSPHSQETFPFFHIRNRLLCFSLI